VTGDEAIKLAGYVGGAIAALAGPILVVIRNERAKRADAMREAMRDGPIAPAPLPVVSATDATRVVQLESELKKLRWDFELVQRALDNERREADELRRRLTEERLAAAQDRMLALHERLADSGLTPIESPPTTPRGKRPRRRD
jgi:hypothetical protein